MQKTHKNIKYSRSKSSLLVFGSDDFCFLIYRRLFYFDLLFLGETITDITRKLISDTGVVALARFPTGRAVIVGVEWIAEVTAFRLSCL